MRSDDRGRAEAAQLQGLTPRDRPQIPNILELEQVSKSFGGLEAVKAVSLSVRKGELLGLIGPNGAGKTTLFSLITGALVPSTGRIVFQGTDITEVAPHVRCRLGIARTFQLARPFPGLSALENVAIGRIYGRDAVRSRSRAEDESRAYLEQVGLADRGSVIASNLTQMNRKRLEVARALASNPRLLLLDEFLAGLGASEVLIALELIRGIRETGVTIIMVEHLVKAVFGVADRVAVLNAGELIAAGEPGIVSKDPGVIEAYLGKEVHE